MRGIRRRLAVIVPVICALILLPIATNIATGLALPVFLDRNKWLSWAGVVVFGTIAVLAAVRGQREQRGSPTTVVLPDDRRRAIRNIREVIRLRLDQSLGGLVRAELELDSVRDAVAPPTRTYVGVPGGTWEPDHSSTVLDAFDRFDESVLILGEPGAGKTTMLLELASALLDRAGDNGPLPVLVELGPWRPGKRRTAQPSEDISEAVDAFCIWLLDRVQATYSIGAEIAAAWLDERGLALLLDGLDEVAPGLRTECVVLFSGLQNRHPRLRIAVTSRSEQYSRLPHPLTLRGAIVIRPLAMTQITTYLSDPALTSLREAVRADPALQELLTVPLWLYLMTVAFRHAAPVLNGDLAERGHQLLDHYVARMLTRRREAGPQHEATTAFRMLVQVARSLHRRNETVLRFNPSWVTADDNWFQSLPAEYSAYLASLVLPVTTVLISLPFLWLFGRQLGPVGILVGLAIFVLAAGEVSQAVAAPRPPAARWRSWRWTLLALLVTARPGSSWQRLQPAWAPTRPRRRGR